MIPVARHVRSAAGQVSVVHSYVTLNRTGQIIGCSDSSTLGPGDCSTKFNNGAVLLEEVSAIHTSWQRQETCLPGFHTWWCKQRPKGGRRSWIQRTRSRIAYIRKRRFCRWWMISKTVHSRTIYWFLFRKTMVQPAALPRKAQQRHQALSASKEAIIIFRELGDQAQRWPSWMFFGGVWFFGWGYIYFDAFDGLVLLGVGMS